MFMQIHMLQSVPPGNLNRDDSGQPKKCLFGGVTRGRISSQCLKRNIRRSQQFKEAFGEELAVRTKYLPSLVADAIKAIPGNDIPEKEIEAIKTGLASRFKKEEKSKNVGEEPENTGEETTGTDMTPQLVFFRPAFANKIANLVSQIRRDNPIAYKALTGAKAKKEDEKAAKAGMDKFTREAFEAKESLSIDVAMFGRMTTSEIVADVEASCQVAHALSTHETLIESDYFTAMDDERDRYAKTKTSGAAFLGSGDTETFFNSAVYYKYLNLDTSGFLENLKESDFAKAAKAAATLVEAAALATPTGKQNAFAAHSVPELIMVELSAKKQPISYANAFLQPVQAADLMAASAGALSDYCASVAAAFSPSDTKRFFLAVGLAKDFRLPLEAKRLETLAQLASAVETALKAAHSGAK